MAQIDLFDEETRNRPIEVNVVRSIFQDSHIPFYYTLPTNFHGFYLKLVALMHNHDLERFQWVFEHPLFNFLPPHYFAKLLKASLNYPEFTETILKHQNTDVNFQDRMGATPLGWCTFRENGVFYKLLETRNINIHLQNRRGQNVLFFCRSPVHVQYLLILGIDWKSKDFNGRNVEETLGDKGSVVIYDWPVKRLLYQHRLNRAFPDIWIDAIKQLVTSYTIA